jgi:hypothetical protein
MTEYKKIYKKRNLLGGANNLMVCQDHLLCIKNRGYSEDYKRFFFADINWIKLVPVRLSLLVDAILAIVALVVFLLALNFINDKMFICAWIMFGIIFLLIVYLILNHLLGPSAKMIIKTYNQQDELTLKRYRKAVKVLQNLKAYINEAQGEVSKAELLGKINADEDDNENVKVI